MNARTRAWEFMRQCDSAGLSAGYPAIEGETATVRFTVEGVQYLETFRADGTRETAKWAEVLFARFEAE